MTRPESSAGGGGAAAIPGPGPERGPRIEIRLLGGFEVRVDDRPLLGFESQKVRCLLAYLAASRGTPHARERLAALFWPEHDPANARSSLRQALYNLRSTLSGGDPGWQPVLATHQTVALDPGPELWVDLEAFEEGLRLGSGSSEEPADALALARAAELYRGELLAGCAVRDSEEFQGWLEERQERLREGVAQALRSLIALHRERGGYRVAVQYAQRLLGIDPLAEEAHRHLMRLYALSGRRGRALAQYEELRDLLRRELGVDPEEESEALYQAILREELREERLAGEGGAEAGPAGPFIPRVGREPELEALRRIWAAVAQGRGAFTLIEGEPGVGKTRLAKTFLGEAERDAAAVLLARCQGPEPEVPYQPVREALRNEIADDLEAARWALRGAADGLRGEIARLLPELEDPLRSAEAPPEMAAASAAEAHERLGDAVWQVLRRLTAAGGGRRARPVVLFLDDLHWADRPTLGLLERLLPRLASAPVWILATAAAGWRAEAVDPLLRLRAAAQAVAQEANNHLPLARLTAAEIRRVAAKLVGERSAGELAALYGRYTGGLPLVMAELTNLLADEGVLTRAPRGGWTLGPLPAGFRLPEPAEKDALRTLREIVLRRVSRLPTSTRRLLTLASVLGHRFDASLLRQAEGEHALVVECGLEMMLDRWLVRHAARQWYTSRRERDSVLWASGARRGAFEFSHELIRRALYDALDRTRRRILHRQVAEILERRAGEDRERFCEPLAYHYARAGAWDRSVVYLKMAADRASRLSVEPLLDPAALRDVARGPSAPSGRRRPS